MLKHTALQQANVHSDGVKEHARLNSKACIFQAFCQSCCLTVHTLRNRFQTFWTVKHCIHRGHHRQQRLSSTDVGVGLFTADVLFTSLQRQAIRTIALCINRHTNNPARHRPFVGIFTAHIGRVWTTVAYRHTKALGAAYSNICAHRAWLFQQGQCQRICCDNADRLVGVQRFDLGSEVTHVTMGARILEDRTEDFVRFQIIGVTNNHFDAQRRGSGLHHRNVLRMAVFVHKESFDFGLGHTLRHGHRFGTSRGFIQQRGVGHIQPRQIGYHGLVVQKRF
mmetsp:Transcript_27572/g.51149  ORF Transcript_27572/g.51149 Transcript_27572/m.51149 type:complete len:280 (-) Transcript_27572:2311-3150(-)